MGIKGDRQIGYNLFLKYDRTLLHPHRYQIKLKIGDVMSEITLDPDQLKEILKLAIVELIRDNRQEVSEFLAEVIEDVAMERAIEWMK
ncbi:hypothetical protein [Vacuolonema iberomarrocanum]|uniref:hypothetical protein n=1 Tax=Vacuolonema iberomarrocanum TaxID=3454632 RepID=UPI001A099ECD|nr:hypothetical protein [filamentous cyanobacterium LEGE 07170]